MRNWQNADLFGQRLREDVGKHFVYLPVARQPPPAPPLSGHERGEGDPAGPQDGEQRRKADLSVMRRRLPIGPLLALVLFAARERLVLRR